MKPLPPARLDDVARLAGTSTITVSRALRLPDKVAPATRARILQAVEELGYIPNSSASTLASRRSGVVGLLTPTLNNSTFSDTIRGFSDAMSLRGLQILLGDFAYTADREVALLRALAGRQVEAILVIGLVQQPAARKLLQSLDIPVIETWDLTRQPIGSVVGFSNRAAGSLVARHFLGGGRRHLAFGGGGDSRAFARQAGFLAAARKAGCDAVSIMHQGHRNIEAGRSLIDAILARAPATDAVFFASDALAVGALAELQDRGIDVPRQIAIAGLGNLELGRVCRPQLTTVDVNAYQIGERAGAVITQALDGSPATPQIIDVGMTLLPRGTTG